MLKKYTTLFFDADNTLLDFNKTERQAFWQTMKHYGITPSEALFKQYSVVNHSLWRQFEQGTITKEALVIRRFDLFFGKIGFTIDSHLFEQDYQKALGQGAFLIDGALDLVKQLTEHFNLYILTNGVASTQYSRLALTGLDTYMNGIFVSEEAGAQKPDTAFFNWVFAKIPQIDKSQILMIGDSLPSDIAGGIQAGIDTCWYNPDKCNNPTSITPDYTITSYLDLIKLLEI